MSPPLSGLFYAFDKNMYFWYLTDVNHWYIFTSIESPNRDSPGPHSSPLFNSQRNTNKDGTASTATGDQIAPKGYQREDHLDG
jgi:hypothetical protein